MDKMDLLDRPQGPRGPRIENSPQMLRWWPFRSHPVFWIVKSLRWDALLLKAVVLPNDYTGSELTEEGAEPPNEPLIITLPEPRGSG
jgi:hypothetical protein